MTAANYTNIVGNTKLDGLSRTEFDGRPVIEDFGVFLQLMRRNASTEAASLFALPEISVSRLTGIPFVTWYSDRGGDAVPLSSADEAGRAAAQSRVATLLAELTGTGDDRLTGMVQAATSGFTPEMIRLVGGQPVLLDWGLSAAATGGEVTPSATTAPVASAATAAVVAAAAIGAGTAAAAAAQPPRATAPTPPQDEPAAEPNQATDAQHMSNSDDDSAGPAESAYSARTSSGGGGGTGGTYVPPPPPVEPPPQERERNRWALISLLVITAALAIALIYILWPGNMVYPEAERGLLDEAEMLEVERSSIAAMQEQIGLYRDAMAEDICVAEPNFILDSQAGLPIDPPLLGDLPATGIAPQTVPPVLPGATVDPLPGAADATEPQTDAPQTDAPPIEPASTEPASPSGTAQLIDRLDEITVLVIGRNDTSTSTGTGFLVAPDKVLTNFHVVEETLGGELMVASRKLGDYIPATVIGRTQTSDIGGADFALLQLERPSPFPPAVLADPIERLDPVIAAGYPAFVVETDPGFIAGVQRGDVTQLNRVQMAVTQGVVMADQGGINDTRVIAHSATISSGNSGGPLVDLCGRVVGVNTFARTDAENALRNNYALGARDAVRFLVDNGVDMPLQGGECTYPTAGAPTAPAADADTAVPADPATDAAAPAEPAPEAAVPAEPAAPAAEPEPTDAAAEPAAPAAAPAPTTPAPSSGGLGLPEPASLEPSTPAEPAGDPPNEADLLTVPVQ